MKTSKINNIKGSGTWTNRNNETMYQYDVLLEDGTVGQVSSKTQGKWNVGDNVAYKVIPSNNNYPDKLKLDKPEYANSHSQASNQSFGTSAKIAYQGCVNNASNLASRMVISQQITQAQWAEVIKHEALNLFKAAYPKYADAMFPSKQSNQPSTSNQPAAPQPASQDANQAFTSANRQDSDIPF